MSQFASVDLPIILGGLAVVGSVGGTAIGVWLGSRREHQHWLRTERALATYLAAERRFLIAASHALGAILPRENWLTSRLDEDECLPDDAGSQVG